MKGRRGLGTIHVVPSGPPGSQLSNNIDTITVNGIGRYGTVLANTYKDASVLTSGLGVGNNLTSTSMVLFFFNFIVEITYILNCYLLAIKQVRLVNMTLYLIKSTTLHLFSSPTLVPLDCHKHIFNISQYTINVINHSGDSPAYLSKGTDHSYDKIQCMATLNVQSYLCRVFLFKMLSQNR